MAILIRLIPLLFFLASFGWMLRVMFLPGYPDYQVHYYGAQHLIQGENPYVPDANYFTPQVYPPFDMVFFIPLSFLPYDISSKVWSLLSISAIVLSIVLINKIYKVSFFSPLSLFLSGLVFIAFPTKFTLGMGQINGFILFFTTLLWYYFNKKQFVFSGIAFAFSVMLKFFPLLLIPYFVYLKKLKVLFTLTIAIFILIAVSLLFVPFDIQYNFFTSTLPELLASWKGDYYNQSFTGLLMRNLGDDTLRQQLRVIFPLIMLIVTFVAFRWNYKKSQIIINIELSAVIILSILINNFSWQHHYLLLLLPFFILTYTIRDVLKDNRWYVLLAVSYALISVNFAYPLTLPSIVQSHVFFGGLLLWFITLAVLFKIKHSTIKI